MSGGFLDSFLCVLQLPDGRFHAAMFNEHPFPGSYGSAGIGVRRFKSKMHHTASADTWEVALEHLESLRERTETEEAMTFRECPVPVDDPVNVWLLPWRVGKLGESLRSAGLLPQAGTPTAPLGAEPTEGGGA